MHMKGIKELHPDIKVSAATMGPKHHFFGYYDKCPWDREEKFLLSLEVDFLHRLPEPDDVAVIGIVDLRNSNFQALAETSAWNFQQGCMLQWLGPQFNRWIIYNIRQGERFAACLLEVKSGEKIILPLPVYAVHPSGEEAVTTNFARLHRVRKGYGYSGGEDLWASSLAPEQDGIYHLNLKTQEHGLIISLARLFQFNHLSSMEQGQHWVDHLTYNKTGTRFCFLHRWELPDGGIYTRLMVANKDGSALTCLLDSGSFSHFDWRNADELLGWGRLPNRLNQTRRSLWMIKYFLNPLLPLYHKLEVNNPLRRKISNSYYLLLRDGNNAIQRIGPDILDQDGHCTWSPDGRWILTDTYPDHQGYRSLILFNFQQSHRINLGKFYSFPDISLGVQPDWNISGMRCDLHPRWSRRGSQICLDSVHEGTRQLYILSVNQLCRK